MRVPGSAPVGSPAAPNKVISHFAARPAGSSYQLSGGPAISYQEAQQLRRQTAADVLHLLSGGSPSDPALESAVRVLPARVHAPGAWLELEAAVQGAGPAAVGRALSPRRYRLPRIEGTAGSGCELGSAPAGRRFRARLVNHFLARVFEAVPGAVQLAGLPAVHLTRWDLFHGHLFHAAGQEGLRGGGLGILLHAKEYPARDAARFPLDLGFCQAGSPLAWKQAGMDWRNLLWWRGGLAAVDLSGGSPLRGLLMEGLGNEVQTVLEEDFGQPLADVVYLPLAERRSRHRVFCSTRCKG